ncbi:MAG: DNA repair protein RecN [Chloroflexota bacterium]
MLVQLAIRDFAIIDRLTIDWQPGFTVLTGETGAGKSIIIDAVGALLGGRVSPEMVRSGASRAVVDGVFSPRLDQLPGLDSVLAELGIELDEGALILTREIAAAGGRGAARVNARAVPTVVLQRIGEQLIDIHGQSEHLSLLRPREHLELLDQYAQVGALRGSVSGAVVEMRRLEREIADLRERTRRAAREQELLRHEIDEIEGAALQPDEEQQLISLRRRLRNAERLRGAVAEAYAALQGTDEVGGALEMVGRAAAATGLSAGLDERLSGELELLNSALVQLEDAERALARYLDSTDDDPGELESVEQRLMLISDLRRKYGDSVAEVLAFADDARQKLREAEQSDELVTELRDRLETVRAALAADCGALSAARRGASARLEAAVERELTDLGMGATRFRVGMNLVAEEGGLAVQVDGVDRSLQVDGTGIDRVEMLIATGAGDEPRGLGRIASGGELARVALGLKSALSQVDPRATLIFDEVDTGVGGRTAPVVGEKLWRLSSDHQVLCVTHMPQVAAFADSHYVVGREDVDGGRRVSVRVLGPGEREDELSQMLGASFAGAGARQNAAELLAAAASRKAPGLSVQRRSKRTR